MATARMAIGNVLGVVSDASTAVSSVFSTLNGGASMLNDYVARQRIKQQDTTKVELHQFRKHLIQDAAIENLKREETVRSYIGDDTVKQEAFKSYTKELNDLFKEEISKD